MDFSKPDRTPITIFDPVSEYYNSFTHVLQFIKPNIHETPYYFLRSNTIVIIHLPSLTYTLFS